MLTGLVFQMNSSAMFVNSMLTAESKQGIENHEISVHSKKKPFKCNVCDASFSLKYKLKSHTTVHEKKRPFQCTLCDAKFKLRILF